MNVENKFVYIKEWIKSYAQQNNIKKLVVGVSGGIDSSVVSTLCAETGITTIVVEMPINKDPNDLPSKVHVEFLKDKYGDIIESYCIDLTNAFMTMQETLIIGHKDLKNADFVYANMASRLRMTTLYGMSNSESGIVVGTGNKVEDFGVGFFTRGGDGTVDISPIADLMKSEVYELGEYMGLDKSILEARPTDGLWEDGRTDEDQIGATYDELEWAMNFVDKNGNRSTGKIEDTKKLTSRELEVLNIYLKFHNKNRFKMMDIPICYIN